MHCLGVSTLQSVQDAAAWLMTGIGRCDHAHYHCWENSTGYQFDSASRSISRARLQVSPWANAPYLSDDWLSNGRQLWSSFVVGYTVGSRRHVARRQEPHYRRSAVLEQPDINNNNNNNTFVERHSAVASEALKFEPVTFQQLLKPICLGVTRAHSDFLF